MEIGKGIESWVVLNFDRGTSFFEAEHVAQEFAKVCKSKGMVRTKVLNVNTFLQFFCFYLVNSRVLWTLTDGASLFIHLARVPTRPEWTSCWQSTEDDLWNKKQIRAGTSNVSSLHTSNKENKQSIWLGSVTVHFCWNYHMKCQQSDVYLVGCGRAFKETARNKNWCHYTVHCTSEASQWSISNQCSPESQCKGELFNAICFLLKHYYTNWWSL